MNASIRELSCSEVDAVDGGLLFLIPLVPIVAAGFKGAFVGAAAAGVVLTVADAFGLVEVY